MPLDLSTYSYTPATFNLGTVDITQLRFKPASGDSPTIYKQSLPKYACWGNRDMERMFYSPDQIILGVYLWGDDSIPADISSLEWGHRVTNINLDSTPNVISKTWDRFELVDVARIFFEINGYPGTQLLFAASDSALNTWYYPNPTHLHFNSFSVSNGPYVMCNDAPTHPKAVIQPYRFDVWRKGEFTSGFQGIGPLSDDGTRLLVAPFRFHSAYEVFPTFFKQDMGSPLYPHLSTNGPQLLNGLFPSPVIYSNRSTAYGLPPEVEISAQWISSDEGGKTLPSSVELVLHLVQTHLDGTESDSVACTTTIPLVSSSSSGGVNYKVHILNPTNASALGTLSDDAVQFRYYVKFTINGSVDVDLTFPASIGPGIYSSSGGTGYVWHKLPCSVMPYATDGCYNGESTYLPGWVYDPNA